MAYLKKQTNQNKPQYAILTLDWPHSMGTVDQAVVEVRQHCWDCSQTMGSLEAEVQTQPWVMKGCLEMRGCWDWPHSMETMVQTAVEVRQHC